MADNKLAVQNEMTITSLSEIFAQSGYFSDARGAAQAAVKILAGRELGLPPIASMTGINIIKGKVSLSAVVMASVLKRTPGYDYKVVELSESICKIEFIHSGQSLGVSKFDMQDAKQAGLLDSGMYKKYPRNMLFARAMSNGIRWYCPEVLGGPAYTPGEIEAGADSEGEDNGNNVIDVEVTDFAEYLREDETITAKVKELDSDGLGLIDIVEAINKPVDEGGFGRDFGPADIQSYLDKGD